MSSSNCCFLTCVLVSFFLFFFFKFYFIFKLYIIVLVLPNIKMNPPQVRGRSGGLIFPSLLEFSTVYCDPHSQMLWHSQWSRNRCFCGIVLLFPWSSRCWQFDLWFLCLLALYKSELRYRKQQKERLKTEILEREAPGVQSLRLFFSFVFLGKLLNPWRSGSWSVK